MDHGSSERPPELSLVVVRVGDLGVSRRFYEQLGLEFAVEQHGRGPEHLAASLGNVVFELYPLSSGASTAGLRLGIAVTDLELVAERCRPAVVDDRERDGRRVVVVQDPDGHKVELTQVPLP